MAFSQMLLWGESRSHRYAELHGHLVTSFQKKGEPRIWYPPIGPHPAALILEHLHPKDGFSFLYVPDDVASGLRELHPISTPERFDYVYNTKDIQSLNGTAYDAQRRHIRKCMEHHPRVTRLDASHKTACLDLFRRWVEKTQEEPYPVSVHDEISAFSLAMEHFDALKLVGVGLEFGGQMEALAIGAPLNATTVVEHFEKSSGAYPGLYQCVFHEFAKSLPDVYSHINKEEDLGVAGLKQAKEGWHPRNCVQKYKIMA